MVHRFPVRRTGVPKEHPPRYLDIELAAYRSSANLRQKVHLAVDWPEPLSGLGPSSTVARTDHRTSHVAGGGDVKIHSEPIRDLKAKVRAKADAMVAEAMVTGKVSTATTKRDVEIINESATREAIVRLSHRTDIARSRGIVMNLLAELEAVCGTENAALLEELGEVMRNPDDNGQDKRNDLYQKLMSLPGRAKTMKDLGDSLKTMIGLEREAFSLDSGGDDAAGKPGKEISDAELAVRLFDILGVKT